MNDVSDYMRALDQEITESAQLTNRQTRRPVRRRETPGTLAMQAILDTADSPFADPADAHAPTPGRLQRPETGWRTSGTASSVGVVRTGKQDGPRTVHVTVVRSPVDGVTRLNPVDRTPVGIRVTVGMTTDTIQIDLEAERVNRTTVTEVGQRSEPQAFTESAGHETRRVTREGAVTKDGPHSKSKR